MTTLSVAEPEPPLLVDPGPVAGPPFPLRESKASSRGAAWNGLSCDILGKDIPHAVNHPLHIPHTYSSSRPKQRANTT